MLKPLVPGGPLAATGHRWEPKPLKGGHVIGSLVDPPVALHRPEAMPGMQVVTWYTVAVGAYFGCYPVKCIYIII